MRGRKAWRVSRALTTFLLLTLWLATASCKRSDVADNENGAANSNAAVNEETTIPPFATKEPERYQATRVITNGNGQADAATTQTFIARDGDRRREDYEAAAGLKISLLQLPGRNFILVQSKKIYAEVPPETTGADGGRAASVPQDFSPEKLLNEARTEARYENLGAEDVGGRATRKYRVTVRGKTGAAKDVTTETLVWVDEQLGMPVKSETVSNGGAAAAAAGSKVMMELRDIKESVDEGLFNVPPDYKKVEYKEILAQAAAR